MKHLMKYLRAVVWCLPFLLLLPPSASAGEAGTLRFPEDGKLKIAVFSDLQTTQNVPRNLLEDLCAVLDAEELPALELEPFSPPLAQPAPAHRSSVRAISSAAARKNCRFILIPSFHFLSHEAVIP